MTCIRLSTQSMIISIRIWSDCLMGVCWEKEIQLCCLLCAGFSTKEISVVTQQSVRTIYQRKTDIRHKLGMDEKEDIIGNISARTANINFSL